MASGRPEKLVGAAGGNIAISSCPVGGAGNFREVSVGLLKSRSAGVGKMGKHETEDGSYLVMRME